MRGSTSPLLTGRKSEPEPHPTTPERGSDDRAVTKELGKNTSNKTKGAAATIERSDSPEGVRPERSIKVT